jgi:hypothetical protein
MKSTLKAYCRDGREANGMANPDFLAFVSAEDVTVIGLQHLPSGVKVSRKFPDLESVEDFLRNMHRQTLFQTGQFS